MLFLVLCVVLASCTTPSEKRIDADAGVDPVDGAGDGYGADAGIDSGNPIIDAPDAPSSTSCVTTGDGTYGTQCCPFMPICSSGLACYYHWVDEAVPMQETAYCDMLGTPQLGDECSPGPGSECAAGLFCDQVRATDPIGHCRALCEPGSAQHGCSAGLTCHGVPLCGPMGCIETSSGDLGICQ